MGISNDLEEGDILYNLRSKQFFPISEGLIGIWEVIYLHSRGKCRGKKLHIPKAKEKDHENLAVGRR